MQLQVIARPRRAAMSSVCPCHISSGDAEHSVRCLLNWSNSYCHHAHSSELPLQTILLYLLSCRDLTCCGMHKGQLCFGAGILLGLLHSCNCPGCRSVIAPPFCLDCRAFSIRTRHIHCQASGQCPLCCSWRTVSCIFVPVLDFTRLKLDG